MTVMYNYIINAWCGILSELIAGFHVTSWRPCWCSRIIACLSPGTQLYFYANSAKKKLYCIEHQHGRLVTWLKTKNCLYIFCFSTWHWMEVHMVACMAGVNGQGDRE